MSKRRILKDLPGDRFVDHGENAEMRWDSVGPELLTEAAGLFVRSHTATPEIHDDYALVISGEGLVDPGPHRLPLVGLRGLAPVRRTALHECAGNGRRKFAEQQGQDVEGTAWGMGAVAAITWEGVALEDVLDLVGGVRPDAVDVMATGLDEPYVENGVDHGRVRRPLPVGVARERALLAWGMNGGDLPPDHGAPLRLVVPGWAGVASIKWLGSLEVSRQPLESPWTTQMYRMSGGDFGDEGPVLTVLPVRSAWELAEGAGLSAAGGEVLHGRSWSGAGPIARVQVSLDDEPWRDVELDEPAEAWTRWSFTWPGADPGSHVLRARATDAAGRTQPLEAAYNRDGYYFDAVVHHPVHVAP